MDLKKVPNWIRWPLVPIASAVTLVMVTALAKIFFFLQGSFLGLGAEAWLMRLWENIFGPGIAGFATVYVGVQVSPYGQKVVAIVIGSVMMMIGGIGFLSYLSSGDWWSLTNVIATVAGVGLSIYATFENATSDVAQRF
jgi:hypothetical protein